MSKEKKTTDSVPRRSMRRLREKENRYNTILKAAEELFARQGFHQTSIEEIADLAEVSTGAVYFYFKNKDDLLIKLMHAIGIYLRKLLGEELQQPELSIAVFEQVAFSFFRNFCVRYPAKIAIFFRESVGQSAEVEEQRRQLFLNLTLDIKEALFTICKQQGKTFDMAFTPEIIAVCIVGIYERVACHYFLWQDGTPDVDNIAQKSVAFMLGGVSNLLEE